MGRGPGGSYGVRITKGGMRFVIFTSAMRAKKTFHGGWREGGAFAAGVFPWYTVMVEQECSRCRGPRDRHPYRYCRSCHNAYMRSNRKPLSPEERKKDNARSYVSVYLKRGKIAKQPCIVCGVSDLLEAHHWNGYDRPLDVRWYCREHHRAEHQKIWGAGGLR